MKKYYYFSPKSNYLLEIFTLMENNKKFEDFLNKTSKKENNQQNQEDFSNENNRMISENDGLMERFDKKLVNKNGKQLIREQLHESN